jgi:hypothetical protein
VESAFAKQNRFYLARMKAAANVPDPKADGNRLRTFFREAAPDHDEEKVYASDMKKIVTWFHILKDLPLFNEEPVAVPAPSTEESAEIAEPELTPANEPAEPLKAKTPKKKKAE